MDAITILLGREKILPGIFTFGVLLTGGGDGGVYTEGFEDFAEMVVASGTTDDSGAADVAYFGAIRGVEVGCKRFLDLMYVCTRCEEPADEAGKGQ